MDGNVYYAEQRGNDVWSYRDKSNLSVRQHIVYEEEAVVDGLVVTYFRLKLANQRVLSGPGSEERWRERKVCRLECTDCGQRLAMVVFFF